VIRMIHFVHPYLLLLLVLTPALVILFAWADRKRVLALERFSNSGVRAGDVDTLRRRRKRACLLTSTFCLIVALSQPVWTRSTDPSSGDTGDVVFVLDVSRSMLSTDVAPTRLARAKSIVSGLAQKLEGERRALVVFAGIPAVQCPLTIDKAFFDATLERSTPNSVARGGTRIGDAIQFALQSVFDDVVRTRRQLVILTDGGDQDSLPALAAKTASTRGIGLLVIGIGDDRSGAFVPTSESDSTPVVYRGEQVRTKQEEGTLRGIAEAGSGTYLDAELKGFDSSRIYHQYIARAPRSRFGEIEQSAAHWLVLFAIALLIGESFLTDRKTRAMAIAVILAVNLSAQTPSELVSTGNIAFRESHWNVAIDLYETAALSAPVPPQVHFNLGAALYRMRRYGAAADAFGRAAEAAKGTPLEATSKLGQANCAYREAIDAPPRESQHLLRRVLTQYEELSSIADARFNADVVRLRLTELQKRLSEDTPETPSAHKKAFGTNEIVQQGGVPGVAQRQPVDRDW
jgi:Ca-activated chloride channel homolog